MDNKEYLPLSWLSQADYCLRRAALLLNERVWVENAETAKGRAEHEHVHTQRVERRGESLKLYENTVYSDRLNILGKCDCIETEYCDKGCIIPAAAFPVRLYPVEYKHGKVRDEREYEIQLCAQTICLEEMYETTVERGAIYYISSHRRKEVIFTEELRQAVIVTAHKLHDVRRGLSIPAAEYGNKCIRCSLAEYCMPKVKRSANQYCRLLYAEAKGDVEV